jgi:hypothetical protein
MPDIQLRPRGVRIDYGSKADLPLVKEQHWRRHWAPTRRVGRSSLRNAVSPTIAEMGIARLAWSLCLVGDPRRGR